MLNVVGPVPFNGTQAPQWAMTITPTTYATAEPPANQPKPPATAKEKIIAQSGIFVKEVAKEVDKWNDGKKDPLKKFVTVKGHTGNGPCFHYAEKMAKWLKGKKESNDKSFDNVEYTAEFYNLDTDQLPNKEGVESHIVIKVTIINYRDRSKDEVIWLDAGTPAKPFGNLGDENGVIDNDTIERYKREGKLKIRKD